MAVPSTVPNVISPLAASTEATSGLSLEYVISPASAGVRVAFFPSNVLPIFTTNVWPSTSFPKVVEVEVLLSTTLGIVV